LLVLLIFENWTASTVFYSHIDECDGKRVHVSRPSNPVGEFAEIFTFDYDA